jgi:hypothetical protein
VEEFRRNNSRFASKIRWEKSYWDLLIEI